MIRTAHEKGLLTTPYVLDVEYVLENTTGIGGFYGTSRMEPLPTEIAMTENVKRLKKITRG